MIALYCALLLAFIHLNDAEPEPEPDLESLVLAGRITTGSCTNGPGNNINDCLDEQIAEPPTAELVNEVTLVTITYREGDGCCFTYRSVYYPNKTDCAGESPEQSHVTILPVCPEENIWSVKLDGASASVSYTDSSICQQGLKIDRPCGTTCEYEICVGYTAESGCRPGQCPSDWSYYAVKSGKQVSYGLIQAPSCDCETENPTSDPTETPTKSPTRNPSVSPTRNPTRNPSVSPTRNPTPAPTAHCEPIVEVNINEGCTFENIELWDTNIRFTAAKPYTNASAFGTLYETPADSDDLTEIVLQHGCNGETTAVPAAEAQWVEMKSLDVAPMEPKQVTPSPDVHSPLYEAVIALLSVYSVVMSLLYLRKRSDWSKGVVKGQKVIDFEEEEEQNML